MKRILSSCNGLLCLMVMMQLDPALALASRLYHVQLEASETTNTAAVESLKRRFERDGLLSVYPKRTTNSLIAWCIGPYPTFADAAFARRELVGRGYKNAECITDKENNAVTKARDAIAEAPTANAERFLTGRTQTALSLFRTPAKLSKSSDADPKELENAKLQNGMYSQSSPEQINDLIKALEPIANGDIAVTSRALCQARFAIGQAYHYGKTTDYLRALQAYTEAYGFAEKGSPEHSACLLQRTATVLGLLEQEIGRSDDVLLASNHALENIPDSDRPNRANTMLLRARMLFGQDRTQQALEAVQEITANFQDQKRELYAASVYEGICLVKLKRLDEAEQRFKFILTAPIEPEHHFRVNVGEQKYKCIAAKWEGEICFQRGLQNDAEVWAYLSHSYAADESTKFPINMMKGAKVQ
jgi:tetratricopeptide (TPR) repeat protein